MGSSSESEWEDGQGSRLVLGDCLEFVASLPHNEKFGCVIADPPYNIGKDFREGTSDLPETKYISWLSEVVEACRSRLAENAMMYVYGFPEIISRLSVLIPSDQQRWLVWHYTNKTVASSRFFQRSHETILALWQPGAKRPAIDIDSIRVPYSSPSVLANHGRPRSQQSVWSRYGHSKESFYSMHPDGTFPRDVIEVPALAGGAGSSERWFWCETCGQACHPSENSAHVSHETWKHPTQKPAKLTSVLLKSSLSESRRVLIPFAGSGAELVAAVSEGWSFAASEIDESYWRFASERLDRDHLFGSVSEEMTGQIALPVE